MPSKDICLWETWIPTKTLLAGIAVLCFCSFGVWVGGFGFRNVFLYGWLLFFYIMFKHTHTHTHPGSSDAEEWSGNENNKYIIMLFEIYVVHFCVWRKPHPLFILPFSSPFCFSQLNILSKTLVSNLLLSQSEMMKMKLSVIKGSYLLCLTVHAEIDKALLSSCFIT